MKRFDQPTEQRALRLLRDAHAAISQELDANADAQDHPVIKEHKRVVARIERFLARFLEGTR